MKTKRNILAVAMMIAAMGLLAGAAKAGVVSVTGVTGHDGGNWPNWYGHLSDMLNGSDATIIDTGTGGDSTNPGMTVVTPDDPSDWTYSGGSWHQEWKANSRLSGTSNGKIGWAALDLGSSVPNLENMYLWNVRHQNNTENVATFNVYTADSPTVALPAMPKSKQVMGDYNFASGGWALLNGAPLSLAQNGANNNTPQGQVALGGVSAQYVGIEILTAGSAAASRIGLAQVEITAGPAGPQPTLTLGSRVLVSENNANFDISVFPGRAKYNDRGVGGSEPGTPTFQTVLGDGTVLDYNFVGNAGTGNPLTTYASGGAGRIPTPISPTSTTDGNGENWANVWTTNDPGANVAFSGSTKNHNPTGVPGAANTFARAADITGTVDITNMAEGILYFPHGTFVNQWSLALEMTGDGQTPLTALDAQTSNGPSRNFGWITDFKFENPDLAYDTITYTYWHGDRDGSPGSHRFMGVILDGAVIPEPATMALLSLAACGLGGYIRKRRKA